MKKHHISAVFLPLAIIFILMLSGCGASTVDLNRYVEINVDGYDGFGHASYAIDYDELLNENLSAFGLNSKSTEGDMQIVKVYLANNVDGYLENDENLANDDFVTFLWNESGLKLLSEKYNAKLNYSDFTTKVSTLEALTVFDPFEGLEVTFRGFDGMSEVNIDTHGVKDNTLVYRADEPNNVSNGDHITITVSAPKQADIMEYEGIKGQTPSATTKMYTVSGLNSFIRSIDQIDAAALNEIDQQIQDNFRAHVAKDWDDPSLMKDIRFVGNYILIPKDPSIRTEYNNIIYFLYEVEATTVDTDEDFTCYYYGELTDIYLDGDNKPIYELSDIIYPTGSYRFGPSGTIFTIGDYYYFGYRTYEDFVTREITAKISSYIYSDNVEIDSTEK